jgi:mannose-6-phosphate isomerase-like protein (cupin superfamily)
MDDYRIDFEGMEWEAPMAGIRHKVVRRGGKLLRFVEYSPEMEPHWCSRGHYGYIIEGSFEVEFEGGVIVYGTGDGVFIPDGEKHCHKARVLSDAVLAVFVEDA